MKRPGAIAATFVTLAAIVGFSLQTGSKTESPQPSRNQGKKSAPASAKKDSNNGSGCSNLKEELEEFLEVNDLRLPETCFESGVTTSDQEHQNLAGKTSQIKFVIAILPDPVHTHFPVSFDQLAAAILEGAQDEKYDFDSSWFPWSEDNSSYSDLTDEKTANLQQSLKESQPGVILFRKTTDCDKSATKCEEQWPLQPKTDEVLLSETYRQGLVVFVVGEDATHGIHRQQFRSALAWVASLQSGSGRKGKPAAILGPSFSGSLPSLAQILKEPGVADELDVRQMRNADSLAVYSGSVSSEHSAQVFQGTFPSKLVFHSFVQSDDEILRRFCRFIKKEQPGFDFAKVAIISEDETAYGSSGMKLKSVNPETYDNGVNNNPNNKLNNDHDSDNKDRNNECRDLALKLYYPRDISGLRGAYQSKSLFGSTTQTSDTQKTNLPTDLADPTGKVHDSLRSYGGKQTPLNQEAFLMEIVSALRELHARYIFLRSSNTLDQLFLTDFLHRSYTDGRIVIFNSDLLYIRERGATNLNGTMVLSTYPLFPLERDWTEHQSLPAADRVFGSDTTEATYVAFRLLLNDKSLNDGQTDQAKCHVTAKQPKDSLFLPFIACAADPPIPDYSPPFWVLPDQCGEMKTAAYGEDCLYPGSSTWLTVIGVNRFWPMASLTDFARASQTVSPNSPANAASGERAAERATEPGGRPEMPLGMKIFWLTLIGLALFHAWCCRSGSFTAKPAFRAHFASTGDWRHILLIFAGSCCVAFTAIAAGWGCGVFHIPAPGLAYPWFAFFCMIFVCLLAWLAILANARTSWKLSQDLPAGLRDVPRMTDQALRSWSLRASALFALAILIFSVTCVAPVELVLDRENRVLTYWRAMHLFNGVSPIVPIFFILIGFYLTFWFTLHGLALFGPDRPSLPLRQQLIIKDPQGNEANFLRMFSQEDAAEKIECAAVPFDWAIAAVAGTLFVLFFLVSCAIARGVPVRSLGAQNYAIIFLVWLNVCCCLSIVQAWRMYQIWNALKRLLTFLDRLTLRRTLGALRGFSWGSVWKMSGNVLEVRYKLISRQIECMNHTITSLQDFLANPSAPKQNLVDARSALDALLSMRTATMIFAQWYSLNYDKYLVGDLTPFREFQKSIASASGILLSKLLVPEWQTEKESLVIDPTAKGDKDDDSLEPPPPSKAVHIRNAEEFVCLNYLGFIQNVLGRLRTMAMTVLVLFLASTLAMSTYPFDPREALSGVLIALFIIVGAAIVKVYADMHRDATLSHVTNTRPGELGPEFWFKILGFGFAPLVGILTRVFPGITDFVFSWLQPGISSLK